MAAIDWDGATFEAHRPLLFSIAYRMLGSASEAEDIVQDAWLRARQDEHADVRSARAYLTTIVTRLCIDHLRSAERTRLEYPGPWLPEPLAEPNQESAELASSLTMAFLVLLEQLAPTERAVFLLREVFELDFDEIARSVGKSETNTRQILTRARGRLRDSRPRFTVSRRESEEMVRRFREGDAEGARRIHEELAPAYELLAVTTGPIQIKAALNLLGHDVGGLRLPLVEASDDEKAQIRDCLERLGVVEPARA